MTTYDVGDQVRLTGTFTNSNGAAANTTAVCTVRKPDGTTSTPSVTDGATGVYTADVTLDQAGRWRYRWSGTGDVIAAGEDSFDVRRRRVP